MFDFFYELKFANYWIFYFAFNKPSHVHWRVKMTKGGELIKAQPNIFAKLPGKIPVLLIFEKFTYVKYIFYVHSVFKTHKIVWNKYQFCNKIYLKLSFKKIESNKKNCANVTHNYERTNPHTKKTIIWCRNECRCFICQWSKH